MELAISYERQIAKRFTWETEISAIIGFRTAPAYYDIDYPLYNYSGFSFTTYPKFYFNPRTYLGIVRLTNFNVLRF